MRKFKIALEQHAMRSRHVSMQVGQVSTPTANVAQALQKTTEANKIDDVVLLLYEEMQQADTNGHRMPLTIVFVERKLRADQVAEALRAETISAAALHGGLSQVSHSTLSAPAQLVCYRVGSTYTLITWLVICRSCREADTHDLNVITRLLTVG